jgi:hypothetical protein
MNELREITVERTAALHGEYPRFRLMARIEHMVLLVTFTILCLTGLPQKFPFSPISTGLIDLLGGIETVLVLSPVRPPRADAHAARHQGRLRPARYRHL